MPGKADGPGDGKSAAGIGGFKDAEDLVRALFSPDDRERNKAAKVLIQSPALPGESPLLAALRIRRNLLVSSRERLDRMLRRLANDLAPVVIIELAKAEGVDGRLLMSCARTILHKDVLPALRFCLNSKDRLLAVLALDAAFMTGGPKAIEILVEALALEDLRWDAISLIRQSGDQAAIGATGRFIQDSDSVIRKEAVAALGLMKNQKVMPYLERIAGSDPDADVRNAAVASMVSVGQLIGKPVDETALNAQAAGAVKTRGFLDELLTRARLEGASDVHIIPGLPVAFRIHGALVDVGLPLSPEAAEAAIREIMPLHLASRYEHMQDADFSHVVEGVGRHRVNVFCERRGMASVIRLIASKSPRLDSLGLPGRVKDIIHLQQGLVLVTGRSGSGKSSTMAAFVREISERTPRHVLTLEDPVEYVFPSAMGIVNQREVGKHTQSFAAGLRSGLREDPDVIVIGEMRDTETMRRVLEASETGHLVIATMHTPDAVGAIMRLIESFPGQEQPQIRISMADSLRMILAQTLVPRADGKGRIAAVELMVVNSAISTLIRENKVNQIKASVQLGRVDGMQTMDNALIKLLESGKIRVEDAISRAIDKDAFRAWTEREKT
jgi:twitching motility protein PilT